MGETPINPSDPQKSAPDSGRSAYEEYGDTLSDVLKDQARRTELRAREAPKSGRKRIHPVAPPVLALFSIWLWLFPPPMLVPDIPTIAPANQEAGLRMGMIILANDIKEYESENGRLPGDLQEMGESLEGVAYVRMSSSVLAPLPWMRITTSSLKPNQNVVSVASIRPSLASAATSSRLATRMT